MYLKKRGFKVSTRSARDVIDIGWHLTQETRVQSALSVTTSMVCQALP